MVDNIPPPKTPPMLLPTLPRVYRHEILAHISNPLRQRSAMYDLYF
ncbi:MAG: hypothetical protein ACE1S7_07620 [Candidatus Tisiphia sp.]